MGRRGRRAVVLQPLSFQCFDLYIDSGGPRT